MRMPRLKSWRRGLFGSLPQEPPVSYLGGARHSVDVEFSSPLNRGVLEYLRSRSRKVGLKAGLESASPTSVADPLAKTHTHPEIGERFWDKLGSSLPVDCRWIVCGAPALVHPQTGVLFGVAIGMAYCLRLTEADLERALKAGAETEHRWSDGSTLDLASQFGPGWVFGGWEQAELEWCRAEYEALGKAGKAASEEGAP